MKKYMVLVFADGDFAHTDFYDDYSDALRYANVDVSWNFGAQIYEWVDGSYVLLQDV